MSYEDTFRDSLSRMRVDSCLSGDFDIALHWKKAWNWNPAGFLWVPSILLLLWMRYIKQHRIKYVFALFWFTVGMTLLNYVINFGNIIAEYKAL